MKMINNNYSGFVNCELRTASRESRVELLNCELVRVASVETVSCELRVEILNCELNF